MTITVTFNPPLPSDDPATFNTKAFATLGDLNTWSTQANALKNDVNQDEAALAAAVSSAQTSASAATTQAGIATTQAGIATTQASNALSSANAAAASLDAFDDRYLGAKASDPTLDNDGNALLTGALYWNTNSSTMRVWSGTAWNDVAQGTSTPTQTFSGTGAQTAFTMSGAPGSLGSLEVFISGVRQTPTTNYTVSGTTLTFVTAPPSGTDNIFVRWISTQPLSVPADGSVTTAKLATLTPGVVISGSSTSDALRITQTGTGNALVVEDSANPDSTPFVIDENGNLVSGHTSKLTATDSVQKLQVIGTNGQTASAGVSYWNNFTFGPSFSFTKSRGGVGVFTSVNSGDPLGTFNFWGTDGTAAREAVRIRGEVDDTPGTGSMPGRLVFSTTPSGSGTPTERMRIDSEGRVGIGATTSPSYTLDVQSPLLATARIKRTTAGSSAYLTIEDGNSVAHSIIADSASAEMRISPNSVAAMATGKGFSISRTAVTAPADSDGNVFSGTYTPTLTNTTNISASTASACQYMRVGNVVTVSGQVSGITMTAAAATSTVLRMTLPIPSAMVSTRQVGGTGVFFSTASRGTAIAIYADPAGDTAEFNWAAPTTTASQGFNFSFTYLVV